MRQITSSLAAAAALAALVSFTVPAAARPSPQEQLSQLLAGKTAGAPVDCLPLSSISASRIIDRTAIVFETSPGKFYLNTPPRDANALESDDTMVIDTRTPELCNVDTVGLRNMATGSPGGFIGLGRFVPYAPANHG